MTKQSLQAGRAVAAMGVVLYHASLAFAQKEYDAHEILRNLTINGLLGVNFFFVLSGFIILMAHWDDIGRPAALGRYSWRRVWRIYPIYWIYLTGYIAAAAMGIGYPDFVWQPMQLLSAYTLMQWVPPVGSLPLKVAWTLFFEVKFYLLFALLIWNRRLGLLALAAWLGWMLFDYVRLFDAAVIETSEVPGLHFFAGMGALILYRQLNPRWYPVFFAAGLLIVGGFVFSYSSDLASYKSHIWHCLPLLAVGFAAIVTGMVMAEDRLQFRVPQWLGFLGDASYSIYLVHAPFLAVFVALLNRSGLIYGIGAVPAYGLAVIGATCAGAMAYALIERPLLRLWSKKLRAGSHKIKSPPVGRALNEW